MEYAGAILLFALGFGGALLAASATRLWRRGGGGSESLPVEDGAVRLDLVGSGRRADDRRDSEPGEAAAQDAGQVEPENGGAGKAGSGRAGRRRSRRRR